MIRLLRRLIDWLVDSLVEKPIPPHTPVWLPEHKQAATVMWGIEPTWPDDPWQYMVRRADGYATIVYEWEIELLPIEVDEPEVAA